MFQQLAECDMLGAVDFFGSFLCFVIGSAFLSHECFLCLPQFLVLDEADRLVERGHFEGLEAVIERIKRTRPDGDSEALATKLR